MKRFDPGPVLPGDAILTSADLYALCEEPTEELQRQIEEGRTMNAPMPHDWQRRGVNAARLLYARLIAGLLSPDEIEATDRVIKGLIEGGGWPLYRYDIQLIRYTIRGCGFEPGRPLKFKTREQDHAETTAS
jgi:hypothetical protein